MCFQPSESLGDCHRIHVSTKPATSRHQLHCGWWHKCADVRANWGKTKSLPFVMLCNPCMSGHLRSLGIHEYSYSYACLSAAKTADIHGAMTAFSIIAGQGIGRWCVTLAFDLQLHGPSCLAYWNHGRGRAESQRCGLAFGTATAEETQIGWIRYWCYIETNLGTAEWSALCTKLIWFESLACWQCRIIGPPCEAGPLIWTSVI